MAAVASLAAVLALAACAAGANGAAEAPWDLEGVVVSVAADPAGTRLTLDVDSGDADARAVLHVPPDARITVRHADGSVRPGGMDDLRPGVRIRARHTGAEMRSLPPQYVATEVQVLAP